LFNVDWHGAARQVKLLPLVGRGLGWSLAS
jgi:hypothetical protein